MLAVASVLATACGSSDGERALPRPRNLLVIAVDTLRADHLGVYGADEGSSPHIDALGDEGIVFEHCASHASWTLPSFASTLTSLYTSTHGCWDFETRLSDSFLTFPEIFQAAGFDTYGIASHIFFQERYGLQQGFDAFDVRLGHKRDEAGWEPLTSPKVSARAERWLDQREGNPTPWLLWLHYFDPHLPYVDHSKARGGPETRDEHDRYRAEITFTDGFVGKVLGALERNGFEEDTCVLFLSDHGESFSEHPGVRRHSRSLFAEELRVPLILRVPGLAPRRVAGLMRTVDIMPTLLELFGIEVDSDERLRTVGRSAVPRLLGEPQSSSALLSEIGLHADAHHARAVLEGRWKLVEDTAGELHLFDFVADPRELINVAAEHPREVERLRAVMNRLREEARSQGAAYRDGERVEHSSEELEHLQALGYVDGGGEDDR